MRYPKFLPEKGDDRFCGAVVWLCDRTILYSVFECAEKKFQKMGYGLDLGPKRTAMWQKESASVILTGLWKRADGLLLQCG